MLGAMQGPAELLPVSSSGHATLVPALLGWRYEELDAAVRKAFEVALHVGGALGLVIALRRRIAKELSELDLDSACRVAITPVPAVVAGLALRKPIERRLGSPRSVAVAQIVAGGALWAADRVPGVRAADDVTASDAAIVGLAQATALVPGVSRAGATLTAARALGLDRPAAARLSRQAALPVIIGAAALEAARLPRAGIPRRLARPFALGTAASLLSAIASAPLAGALEGAPSYAPFAAYRIALGSLALIRLPGAGRAAASD